MIVLSRDDVIAICPTILSGYGAKEMCKIYWKFEPWQKMDDLAVRPVKTGTTCSTMSPNMKKYGFEK